jgi:hypothetical protein
MITVVAGRDTFLALTVETRRLEETLRLTVRDTAREFRLRLVEQLRRPGTGRFYGGGRAVAFRRQRRTVTLFGGVRRRVTNVRRLDVRAPAYRASAPGQPPARRTGTLLRSIRTAFPARDKGFGARIFADRKVAFYRHILEFGAPNRTPRDRRRAAWRLLPRPVFSPLQVELERALGARVLRAVDLFVALGGAR